ncbi:MAG: DUF177 domain-containing protein [Chitinophagaceae bacterium]|nr:DUF177 domain-containing protein [Chitinophagaceae bacterium]
MDPLRQYEIAFVGLKEGINTFNFPIGADFFSLFEDSLVKEGKLEVNLEFDKELSFFLLKFMISGWVNLPCDRCSALLKFPIDEDYNIVVKFDHHSDAEKDDSMADIVYISRSESHLDVSQLIYEFINLSIPLNRVNCDNLKDEKPCNQDILKRLIPQKVKKHPVKDPRWDNLSKIKFN